LNAISGSLLPLGSSNGVFKNERLPAVVAETDTSEAAGAADDVTVIVAVALFPGLLTEVAVSVTVAGLGTVAGAL